MESLSDIVAEMRTRSREVKEAFGGGPDGVENMLDIWADRIEAIDSADTWRSLYTPGNAAEIREALVALRDAARNFCHQILNSKYNDIMDEYKCRERGFPALLDLTHAIPKANLALSAPPRQCDVGTPEEQSERMEKAVCSKHYGCVRCPLRKAKYSDCSLGWAQTPYAANNPGGGGLWKLSRRRR